MLKKCWQWINTPLGLNSVEGEQDHVWWNGFLSFSLLLLVQYFWLISVGVYPVDLLHVQSLIRLEIFGSMDVLVAPFYMTWSVIWYAVFIILLANVIVHWLIVYQAHDGVLDLTFLSKSDILYSERVWLAIWWLVPSYSFSLVLISFVLMLVVNWMFNGKVMEEIWDNPLVLVN